MHVMLYFWDCISDGAADYLFFNLVLVPQDAKQEYPAFDETWFLFRNNGKGILSIRSSTIRNSLRKHVHEIYRNFSRL